MSYLADLERKYIAAIERIKVLEEDNANLRAAVGTMSAGPEVPRALRLTRLEAHLFLSLLAHPEATKEQLLAEMYAHRYGMDDEPEIKIVDVYICKLRRKFRKFPGLEIETIFGRGYAMPPSSKAEIRRMNQVDAARSLPAAAARAVTRV